jgi:hypothetical protein
MTIKLSFFKENRRIIMENAAMIALKTHGRLFWGRRNGWACERKQAVADMAKEARSRIWDERHAHNDRRQYPQIGAIIR